MNYGWFLIFLADVQSTVYLLKCKCAKSKNVTNEVFFYSSISSSKIVNYPFSSAYQTTSKKCEDVEQNIQTRILFWFGDYSEVVDIEDVPSDKLDQVVSRSSSFPDFCRFCASTGDFADFSTNDLVDFVENTVGLTWFSCRVKFW